MGWDGMGFVYDMQEASSIQFRSSEFFYSKFQSVCMDVIID